MLAGVMECWSGGGMGVMGIMGLMGLMGGPIRPSSTESITPIIPIIPIPPITPFLHHSRFWRSGAEIACATDGFVQNVRQWKVNINLFRNYERKIK
jgi:hypothetical protein